MLRAQCDRLVTGPGECDSCVTGSLQRPCDMLASPERSLRQGDSAKKRFIMFIRYIPFTREKDKHMAARKKTAKSNKAGPAPKVAAKTPKAIARAASPVKPTVSPAAKLEKAGKEKHKKK